MSKTTNNKKSKKNKRLSILAIIFVLTAAALYTIITYSGHWLVEDDDFDHVSWIVMLDGQSADLERNDFAAKLLKDGKADSLLILGRRCLRNRNNAEFYVDDFMGLGTFDSSAIFIAPHDDASTVGEAYTIIPWLKAHKADTVLLLTSASATHRVKRIFTELSGNKPVFLTTDIHHYQFNADSWHTNRESRKNWIREWLALAQSYIDLWDAGVLTAADSTYYKSITSLTSIKQQKDSVVDLQTLLPSMEKKIQETIKDVSTDSAKVSMDSVSTEKSISSTNLVSSDSTK